MHFFSKLRDLKNRLTDRHLYSALVALLIFFTGIFAYQAKVSADYRSRLDNQYARAFDDLTSNVYGIETALDKCAAVTEKKSVVRLANDIYAKANAAAASLGQLPLADTHLENTAKFLSQVGDFSYMLALSYMDTPEVSAQERQTMLDLSGYAQTLVSGLYDLQQKLYSGTLRFSEKADAAETLSGNMEQLESRFSDYPKLIYDGPFSDHVADKPPLFLQNLPTITADEAAARVNTLFPSLSDIRPEGEMQGTLPVYLFSASPDASDDTRTLSLQIAKQGGMLLQMLDNRTVSEQKLDIEAAKAHANRFLETSGFLSMRDSYFEIRENIATINFAYADDSILYYPDLVKVLVALDTGEILGLEAGGYAACHTDRAFPPPSITKDAAKSRLSEVLSPQSAQLVVIPRDTQDEALCWEFKCKLEEKTFLVYINAENGHEEDVLMLLEVDGGMLTI